MTWHISFAVDSDTEALSLIAQVVNLAGDHGARVIAVDEWDELSDDEAADDITSLLGEVATRMREIAATADSPDQAILDLAALRADYPDDMGVAQSLITNAIDSLNEARAPVGLLDEVTTHMREIVDTATDPAQAIERLQGLRADYASGSFAVTLITRAIERMTEATTEADPTPPHGIPRPRVFDESVEALDPSRKGKEPYWFRKDAHPTSGSGAFLAFMENVACPTCPAGPDQVCITDTNVPYRRGYGHSARRKAYYAAMGQS